MTNHAKDDEAIVRGKYPGAVCFFSQYFRFWAVFVNGPPRWIGGPKGDWENFFSSGTTKSLAWASAARRIEAEKGTNND